jgi:hypothetical protein
MEVAEAAAWAKKGQDSPNFYIYRRLFVPGLIAAGVGALGYGAYRGWHALADRAAVDGVAPGGVPTVMWLVLLVLLAVTGFAVKGRGRARPFGTVVLVSLATGAAWLFWLGALISMLA